MSPVITTGLCVVFALVFVFIAWLKWREHLHLHRHERGDHSSRTDLAPFDELRPLDCGSHSSVSQLDEPHEIGRNQVAAKQLL